MTKASRLIIELPGASNYKHVVRRSIYAPTISCEQQQTAKQANKQIFMKYPSQLPTTSCVTWTRFKVDRKVIINKPTNNGDDFWLFRFQLSQKLSFKFTFSISILNCFNYRFAMRVRRGLKRVFCSSKWVLKHSADYPSADYFPQAHFVKIQSEKFSVKTRFN